MWLCDHTRTHAHTHTNEIVSRTVLDSPSDDMFWWFFINCALFIFNNCCFVFSAFSSKGKLLFSSPILFYSVLRGHHYSFFYIQVNGFVFWVSIKLCISSSKSSPNCKWKIGKWFLNEVQTKKFHIECVFRVNISLTCGNVGTKSSVTSKLALIDSIVPLSIERKKWKKHH